MASSSSWMTAFAGMFSAVICSWVLIRASSYFCFALLAAGCCRLKIERKLIMAPVLRQNGSGRAQALAERCRNVLQLCSQRCGDQSIGRDFIAIQPGHDWIGLH